MVIVKKDILLLLTAPSETMVVLCRHKLNNHGGEPRHIAKEIEKAYTPPPTKGLTGQTNSGPRHFLSKWDRKERKKTPFLLFQND